MADGKQNITPGGETIFDAQELAEIDINPDNDLNYEVVQEIFESAQSGSIERRKRRDWVTVVPAILNAASVVLLLAAWIVIDNAAPPEYWGWLTFFSNYTFMNAPWQRRPVNIAYLMLIVNMGMCVIAFAFNMLRKKRKTDVFRVSVFVVGIISLIALAAFLIKFVPMGIIGRWR